MLKTRKNVFNVWMFFIWAVSKAPSASKNIQCSKQCSEHFFCVWAGSNWRTKMFRTLNVLRCGWGLTNTCLNLLKNLCKEPWGFNWSLTMKGFYLIFSILLIHSPIFGKWILKDVFDVSLNFSFLSLWRFISVNRWLWHRLWTPWGFLLQQPPTSSHCS